MQTWRLSLPPSQIETKNRMSATFAQFCSQGVRAGNITWNHYMETTDLVVRRQTASTGLRQQGRWKHITTLNMLRRTSLITVHLAAAVVIGGGRRKVPLSQQLALKFVDTEQFQRLCDLKQLGLAYMVYPGAVYSRFEHSLGVYFLAAEAVEKLEKYHGLELGVGPINLQTVKLPGLLHDIGHGPFSHLYEREFLPRVLNGCKWSHEDMSVDMVNYNVDEHHIDVDSGILKRAKKHHV